MPASIAGARPRIILVVALAENGVIGRDNGLAWHLRGDLKRFKAVTMGKPMLMGRKTYASIGLGWYPGEQFLHIDSRDHDTVWTANDGRNDYKPYWAFRVREPVLVYPRGPGV